MRKSRNERVKKSFSPKVLALSGIFLALTVIVLYAESLAPTGRLSLYVLSSLLVSLLVVESDIRAGWLFYFSSSLLAFLIVPDKLALVPYFAFFGLYGIVKCYAERPNDIALEYILKYAYFNLCLVLAFFLVKEFFMEQVVIRLPWWLLVIVLEIVFFLYDYVYSLFIQYYRRRRRR